jgi:hypothetical protein
MRFRQWVEALQVGDTRARTKLAQHPYAQQSGIGVEIEMTAELTPQQIRRLQQQTGEEFIDDDPVEVWTPHVAKLVQDAGFRYANSERPSGATWGIGPDGKDSELGRPILEIRTGIMTPRDMPKFSNFLFGLVKLAQQAHPYIGFHKNTGIHVHVSNPSTGSDTSRDAFIRVAALANIDEPQIAQDMEPYDRPFGLYAKLNKAIGGDQMRNYHDGVVEKFRFALGSVNDGPATKVLSNIELGTILQTLDRDAGINASNIRADKPNTVEYRHLATSILLEPQGVQKLMDYINYYVQHLARKAHAQQAIINGTVGRLVFTRMSGNRVRVDYQPRNQFGRVPQAGQPFDALMKPATGRGDQPFGNWWRNLNQQSRIAYKAKASKASQGRPR